MFCIARKKKNSFIILFSIFIFAGTVAEAKLSRNHEYNQVEKEAQKWFISASTTGTISAASWFLLFVGPAWILSTGFVDTFKRSSYYAAKIFSEHFPYLWWTVPLGGIAGGISLQSFFKYRECQKKLTLKKELKSKEINSLEKVS